MGLRFSSRLLSLCFLGINDMIPRLWLIESIPDLKAKLKLAIISVQISDPKNL